MSTLSVQPKQTETDIAVLQVQYSNLTEKVDDLKTGLKDLKNIIDDNNTVTQEMITAFQKINVESHNEMAKKITALEKWKWMLMGGGVLAGAVLEPLIYKMLGAGH